MVDSTTPLVAACVPVSNKSIGVLCQFSVLSPKPPMQIGTEGMSLTSTADETTFPVPVLL